MNLISLKLACLFKRQGQEQSLEKSPGDSPSPHFEENCPLTENSISPGEGN